jgi:hypothetical protein
MSITEQHGPTTDVSTSASDPGVSIRRPMYATQLRKARTDQTLSVEDVSRRTKVRPAIIEALENGDVEPSGGIVYARGHVRSLAHALGLDPVPLVASFDHAHRDQVSQVPVLAADTSVPEIAGRPRRSAGDGRRRSRWPIVAAVVLVVVIAVALVELLVPGKDDSAGTKATVAPTPSVAAPKPPAAKPKPTSKPIVLPPMTFPVPPQGVLVRIVLPFLPSWMSATDQSGTVLIPPGNQPSSYKAIDLRAANGLRLIVGDASAVAISCNGKPLPRPLGEPGQVLTLDLYRGNPFCPAG